ncbi:hypothetical protein B7T09_20615 [Cronobacter sakazakii]|nr:hypothetical protein [Cronobacter sakazakii]EGZ6860697.1 hypothetical protein [Cronobacter sakazakii]EGZ6870162.1 hypothetical protein [Cronobacter sakazakii]PQY16891.1 hypothetical protein C5957_17690 [Cronobacter sakazakii]PUV71599.1 hypothetical protein B7T09_20615 [Cronobacter sakazakii]
MVNAFTFVYATLAAGRAAPGAVLRGSETFVERHQAITHRCLCIVYRSALLQLPISWAFANPAL